MNYDHELTTKQAADLLGVAIWNYHDTETCQRNCAERAIRRADVAEHGTPGRTEERHPDLWLLARGHGGRQDRHPGGAAYGQEHLVRGQGGSILPSQRRPYRPNRARERSDQSRMRDPLRSYLRLKVWDGSLWPWQNLPVRVPERARDLPTVADEAQSRIEDVPCRVKDLPRQGLRSRAEALRRTMRP